MFKPFRELLIVRAGKVNRRYPGLSGLVGCSEHHVQIGVDDGSRDRSEILLFHLSVTYEKSA